MTTDIAILAVLSVILLLLLAASTIAAYRLWIGPWLRQRHAAKRPFNVNDWVLSPY